MKSRDSCPTPVCAAWRERVRGRARPALRSSSIALALERVRPMVTVPARRAARRSPASLAAYDQPRSRP